MIWYCMGFIRSRSNISQISSGPIGWTTKTSVVHTIYLLKDNDGILWVVPLSSQTENYAAKIRRIEATRGAGNCLYYHIAPVASIDRVFLIGDMFPVNEDYIKAPFTIDRRHYVSRNKNINSAVHSKAMRFLKLVEQGKVKSRNDIMGIKRALMNRAINSDYII